MFASLNIVAFCLCTFLFLLNCVSAKGCLIFFVLGGTSVCVCCHMWMPCVVLADFGEVRGWKGRAGGLGHDINPSVFV